MILEAEPLTEEFLKQIESYLNEKFFDTSGIKYSMDCSGSRSRIQTLLDKIFGRFKQTFPEYLLEYIAQRGLNEVDVYKKAHLDRRMLSKLRNERDYMPSERTLWAIALAMELNLDEALEILHKAGFTLSTHSKEDLIIKFFFENKIYDMFLLNETLDHYGFKPLGG